MTFEHPSGLPGAYDRARSRSDWTEVVMREDRLAQAADINDQSTIIGRRIQRIGNMTARDGDRTESADIFIDEDAGTATLSAGRVYVRGDILNVAAAVLADVPMTGEATVGVRLVETVVTEANDTALLGLHPGSDAEGEPGSARMATSLVWALESDDQDGEYFPVYLVKDGGVIDQTPPPALSGVIGQIALYDRDANGNYVVDGCEVQSLGPDGSGNHVFSISAGTANVQGYKRVRETALRHIQPEAPDLEVVPAEPHIFGGTTGGAAVLTVNRPPIAAVSSAIVVKEISETLVRNTTAGGLDPLTKPAAVSIVSVIQGATTYVAGTDYVLAGNGVSWAPAGAEPAASSTYTVVYRFNEAVTPTAITDTTVTVNGGVNGTTALVSYTSKIPRIDLLCLDQSGRPAYVEGLSARSGGLPPAPPSSLLKLAEIHNAWSGVPTIINNGTRNYTYDQQRRYFGRLLDVLEQLDRQRAEMTILEREPVSKKGIFTDVLVDDFYRDQGATQTAAVNRGVLQLAIDDELRVVCGNAFEHLPYVEIIAVRQGLRTSSMRINPYDNYEVMPGELILDPAVDYWTEEQTQWTSPTTRNFTAAPNEPPGQTTLNEVTEIRRVNATTLRQITVQATIRGMAAGENLAALVFGGVNVKPAGTQTANSLGTLVVSFAIPANMPVGSHTLRSQGAAGSFAEGMFTGDGTIDVTTMRLVTMVTVSAPVPVQVTNVTVINQITEVINITRPVVRPILTIIDPLAQTFSLPEGRHVTGVNFWISAVGDQGKPVRVQLARVSNGWPTNEVLADAVISMAGVAVGQKIEARFQAPIWLPAAQEYCFVILTSDATHAVSIARMGDVDAATQTRVASQPYTVGLLLSSANRLTWTPHQDADMAFEIVVAEFTATTRTVNLWTGALDEISDLLVRGTIELPTDATSAHYEIVRADSSVIKLQPGQTWEAREYISETVTLRAVLVGTNRISPLLYPSTMLAGGRIRATGTYITRAFPLGVAVDVRALFKSRLPVGSSVSVDLDGADNSWGAMTLAETTIIGNGWNEPVFEVDGKTASQGRIRITLNGGPDARPSIASIRAYSL